MLESLSKNKVLLYPPFHALPELLNGAVERSIARTGFVSQFSEVGVHGHIITGAMEQLVDQNIVPVGFRSGGRPPARCELGIVHNPSARRWRRRQLLRNSFRIQLPTTHCRMEVQ